MPAHAPIECLGGAFEFAVIHRDFIKTHEKIPSPNLEIFAEISNLVKKLVEPHFRLNEYLNNLQAHYDRTLGNVRIFYFEARNRQKNYRPFYVPFDKKYILNVGVYKDVAENLYV